MRIAVLTSSRADYGIYYPLLCKLKEDPFFDLKIIVFGTHLSSYHGYTISQILENGFKADYTVESLISGDSPRAIATTMGLTSINFSSLWNDIHKKVDLVFCLGDRYEMFAAVSALVPFNIHVAHIHGGETTLGAIDNKFRHAITQMSTYHFVTHTIHAQKVAQLTGTTKNIYNVGALSLDNLNLLKLYSKEEFKEKYSIDLNNQTILVTFHPETVSYERNNAYVEELIKALETLQEQIVITLPNADTKGNLIRTKLLRYVQQYKNAIAIESFGTKGYFSCMKHSEFLLGNTSSGIIEAASLGKYVINLGDRQKGRICGKNIINCNIIREDILQAIYKIKKLGKFREDNVYGKGNAAQKIIKKLKKINLERQ